VKSSKDMVEIEANTEATRGTNFSNKLFFKLFIPPFRMQYNQIWVIIVNLQEC